MPDWHPKVSRINFPQAVIRTVEQFNTEVFIEQVNIYGKNFP